MTALQTYLGKYAEAIAKVGINVQTGDNIFITCDTDSLPLARQVAKICWAAGAHDVIVKINDSKLQYIMYKAAKPNTLKTVKYFEIDYSIALMENRYHRIYIRSEYPNYFSNITEKRLSTVQKTNAQAAKPLQKYFDQGNIKWVVAAAASPYWAKTIFPDSDEKIAVTKLWQLILHACRIDENDPIENWQKHNRQLKMYENWLNQQNFKYLMYRSEGTDLTVHLAENHKWLGGSSMTPDGIAYMPNIPTEEIFTTPHMYQVNGYVTSTKPLSVMGKIIEKFKLEFKDGAVIHMETSNNKDILQSLLKTDRNAMRLGEVAIVPHSSPISQTGKLFNSTLFDENASCHFALGQSYAETIIGGENLSDAKKQKVGANHSMIHVDFMVGSSKLDISGVKNDGSIIAILKNGEWAFEL